ncbi:MAG: hypothetical protein AAF609_09490 [Cyanobacteria bacterium P01_C01_bin.120]
MLFDVQKYSDIVKVIKVIGIVVFLMSTNAVMSASALEVSNYRPPGGPPPRGGSTTTAAAGVSGVPCTSAGMA